MSRPSIRRAGALVAAGSATGYAVSLALTPVLSRLVDPVEFGRFVSMLAVASAMTGLSTFRIEVRAQSELDERLATGLLRAALGASLGWSVFLTLMGVGAVALGRHAGWALIGVMVFAGSIQLVGIAALSRSRRYRELALGNLGQGAGLGLAQTALCALWSSTSALAAGFVMARLVWIPTLLRVLRAPIIRPRMDAALVRYAGTAGGSALASSLAGQAPLLLLAGVYGPAAAGAYGMASRLLMSPLSVIGQATAAASLGEVGRLLREGSPAWPVVRSALRDLIALGSLPCAGAAILGPALAASVLGDQWGTVGSVLTALGLGALAQFSVAPFAQLLNLTGHSRLLLSWDLARLLLIATAIVGPAAAGWGLLVSLWCYSGALLILYGILSMMLCCVMSADDSQREPARIVA